MLQEDAKDVLIKMEALCSWRYLKRKNKASLIKSKENFTQDIQEGITYMNNALLPDNL